MLLYSLTYQSTPPSHLPYLPVSPSSSHLLPTYPSEEPPSIHLRLLPHHRFSSTEHTLLLNCPCAAAELPRDAGLAFEGVEAVPAVGVVGVAAIVFDEDVLAHGCCSGEEMERGFGG